MIFVVIYDKRERCWMKICVVDFCHWTVGPTCVLSNVLFSFYSNHRRFQSSLQKFAIGGGDGVGRWIVETGG